MVDIRALFADVKISRFLEVQEGYIEFGSKVVHGKRKDFLHMSGAVP